MKKNICLIKNIRKSNENFKKITKENITNKEIKDNNEKIFKLSNTQTLLKNFMNSSTPYRSLLIFHGTGVGKTCTGITIAENLKQIIKGNNKKIYLIRYEEFYSQLFNINNVKNNRERMQCTGNTYLKELIKNNPDDIDLIDKCKENASYCDTLYNKIKKIIKTYYDMRNVEKWARDTEKQINKKNYNLTKQEKHFNKINTIRKQFDNSILIIDEAHHINSPNDELKLITNVLNDILKYSRNIRLILMTATPIWDKPTDIISLINFMLTNDKRPTLKIKDVFKNTGEFQKDGEKLFRKKINGYISYLKGEDPLRFPFRVSSKDIIPKQIIKKYPTNLIKNHIDSEKEVIDYTKNSANQIDAKLAKLKKIHLCLKYLILLMHLCKRDN